MNPVLIETQFFPPTTYLARCIQTDSVIIEAYEHFQKGSYRNRCHIAGANGLQVLSVPLRRNSKNDCGENSEGDIRCVKNIKIAHDVDWQKQHWRTLQTAYGSAPFWDFYAPVFERFFTQRFEFLLDYNVEILKTVFKLLKIEKTVKISLSTTYNDVFTEGSNFRNTIQPKIKNDLTPITYSQLFNDRYAFIPDLSILDLLFCCGNQSLSILKKQ
ncbi:MAG: WbqC family protein [Saprospiraceae bacterium]|nr:WbqC family protein [Saprospiraceae bacterium]